MACLRRRKLQLLATNEVSSEEDVMYKWFNHVVPAYREYLLPYREECHKVITNNTHIAEDIMRVTEEISEELRAEVLPKRLV